MLEEPEISKELLLAKVCELYGIRPLERAFLPIGADVNSAAYQLWAEGGASYFLKLRKGPFDELSVILPQLLKLHGVGPVIAPIQTTAGQYWGKVGEYTLILYPFVRGRDGYETPLTDQQWTEFGAALKALHATSLSQELKKKLGRERYSARWRDDLRRYLGHRDFGSDPIALKMGEALQQKRTEIEFLLQRATKLARLLKAQDLDLVVCHTDLHPGNLFFSENGSFFIVDWDAPLLAPKERDLMFIGGMSGSWAEEKVEWLFYRGYGEVELNREALAYFRYERIIEDMAVECQIIFNLDGGEADREQSYQFFLSNFLPGNVIELAKRTESGRT